MNLEPKMLKQRKNVLKEKKIFGGGKEKLSGKKKTKRKSLVIKQVPVDLKSYWASRKSDCTILQTIQSGGWLFAMRNYDHKRQFCYRF